MGILLSKLKSMGKKSETVVEELTPAPALAPVPAVPQEEPLFKKRVVDDNTVDPVLLGNKLAALKEVTPQVETQVEVKKIAVAESKRVITVDGEAEPQRKRETCVGDACPYQDPESIPKTN